ncbi:HEAT repeat domain-containing protein [Archangium lipolyticum]|uniref:HEAT repeat domain-containing protein n=1 Tax=Archangium lipolyticum TaxID=2970465 RepID=UPI0021499F20|nr:HEAT repeat domain-containing protein [Archangium lipolyticum]
MRGRNVLLLLLAASVALGGVGRAAVDHAEESYVRGLFAALDDADDEVVAWTLVTLVEDVEAVPQVREQLQDFLQSPRATRAMRAGRGNLWKAVLITQGTLGEASADTVRSLVGLLWVEQAGRIRQATERALGKMGEVTRTQASVLVEMLKDPDASVRQSAQTVLKNMGAAAREQAPLFGEMLKDPDDSVRQTAAEILGKMGEAAREQVPLLGEMLKDPHWKVRWIAARALGDMGAAAREQAPRLSTLLEDPDENVRQAAARALENMGESPGAQVPRLDSLPNLGSLSSLEALVEDQDPEVREGMRMIQEEGREMVGLPLSELAAKTAQGLKDPDPAVRMGTLAGLSIMGEDAKAQVPRIVELLRDPDGDVRGEAAMALGELGVREQIPRIGEMLEDAHPSARAGAARALGQLGAREYASRIIMRLDEDPMLLDEDPMLLDEDVILGLSAEWEALVAMGPLKLEDVALLASVKGRNPAGRPMWLALAHGLGGGEPQVERVLRWLGWRLSTTLPRKKELSLEEARATLRAFAELWSYAKRFPLLEEDLSRQIAQVALFGRGRWQEKDRALLELHEKNLRDSQPTRAASVHTALDSIHRLSAVPRVVGWAWAAHAGFWLLLIFFYPRSAQVQAVFFWNPWVRRILGFGYVGVLLTWLPFLRRRLLGPFHRLLLADADLGRFSPAAYFERSEVCVVATGQRKPLLHALPRLRGQVVLEGASGLGKSMFIKYLLSGSNALAVYLPAERCKQGVLEAIQAKLEGHARDTSFLQSIIYSGALDIYIDGLNEVAADTRARIVQFVEPKFHGNILLVTQRMEWTPPATASLYELQSLTEEQVREFLLSREPLLEGSARLRGATYLAACENFLLLALSPTPRQSEELRRSLLEVLSNPMDLTVVARMLAEGHPPDLFRLQQQQYELMARDYQEVNLEEFPLEAFAEEAYRMKLEDRGAIAEEKFGKELLRMEAFKMVVRREWKGADGMEGREWHFRHDKLQDFFIAQTFLGPGNARIIEHVDDPRFRGVYFLLAKLLPPEKARELQDQLVARAAETHDHTVSDEFVKLVEARRRVERVRTPSQGASDSGAPAP